MNMSLTPQQEELAKRLQAARLAVQEARAQCDLARENLNDWRTQDGDRCMQRLEQIDRRARLLESRLEDVETALREHFAAEDAQRQALHALRLAS